MVGPRDLVPPKLARWVDDRRAAQLWTGDHPSWAAAAALAGGYEDAAILERVRQATAAVRDGQAAYERDSVRFDTPDYVWPLLALITATAAANGGRLRVADFGGALGSTYWQHRRWLAPIPDLRWGVVEQAHFVRCGRDEFSNAQLHFDATFAECASAGGGVDIVLFSSVLQYLEDPWAMLAQAKAVAPAVIICDRTAFVTGDRPRVTLQRVPPSIYPASYPCRFLVQRELERELQPYRLELAFPTLDRPTGFGEFRGLLFVREGTS